MSTKSQLNPTNSVTRRHRTAFILLLDLSGSMMEGVVYESNMMTKSVALSDVSNKTLQEFYMRSFRDGEVCDYFDIAIIGYSGGGVRSLLNGNLDNPFVSIKELDEIYKDKSWIKIQSTTPLTLQERLEEIDESSIIISPEGSTPMYEAFSVIHRVINMWCSRYENYDSIAPSVIHVTDGHPSDSNTDTIIDISNSIKSIRTNCSETLLLNIKLKTSNVENKLLFPTDKEIESYPCNFIRMMARSSSIMPENFTPSINKMREQSSAGECYRGFGCNVSIADLISMINIGSLSAEIK